MPVHISASATKTFTIDTLLVSVSISFESITPNTGVIKLNTLTFDTGLYLRSIPQRAYATADKKARYVRIPIPSKLSKLIVPPKIRPMTTIIMPPRIN